VYIELPGCCNRICNKILVATPSPAGLTGAAARSNVAAIFCTLHPTPFPEVTAQDTMKTFIRISLLGLGTLIGLCIVAALKPDHFRVERSIVINAPAETIFPLINDLRQFTRWSPYEDRDPAMHKTFSANSTGHGARYAWDGNKEVGSGRMEIIDSRPLQQVMIQLDFERPMEAHNSVVFSLAPSDSGSTVRWAMEGPMPFVSRLFSIFMDFDAIVGTDFATGLANLKALAEQPQQAAPLQ
jgi:uncharacterized protein YndB with AHSA1/START domain